tara:strand:+ start:326 stop:850 length:525 start_codon:yes stop_codon:yes gene_type:complete
MGKRVKRSVSIDLDVIATGEALAGELDRSFSRVVEYALVEYIERNRDVGSHAPNKNPSPVRRRKQTPPSPPSLKVPPSPSPSKPVRRQKSVAQKPPTSEEVVEYFSSLGVAAADGENFHDYWQSQGWRRKGGPIKDWKAAARVWRRNLPAGTARKEERSIGYNFPTDEHKNPRF